MMAVITKKTLGVYGPKYPDRTGVANYIKLSLPYLRQAFECTHVSNHDWIDPSQFDLVLYHLGNNRMHHCAFEALRRRPGPVLLHEYNNLDYYYSCWDLLPRHERVYILGAIGRVLNSNFSSYEELMRYFDKAPGIDRYSIDAGSEWIAIGSASGVILHSQAVKKILKNRYPSKQFNVLTQPVSQAHSVNIELIRTQYGLSGEEFIFGTFGFIGPYKRLEKIFQAWRQWEKMPTDVRLIVVGEAQYDIALPDDESVKVTGYVSDDHFDSLIVACDCGIQLRYPCLGETSAAMCKLVAHNRPLITNALPEMEDFSRYAGVKMVPTDSTEIQFLINAFAETYEQGRMPRIYNDEFSWEKSASRQIEIILNPTKEI
jgi:glycosyltransferase involved in cell wall biosynthesis